MCFNIFLLINNVLQLRVNCQHLEKVIYLTTALLVGFSGPCFPDCSSRWSLVVTACTGRWL